MFSGWWKMREACPDCQLILDRGEQDYFLGGFTVNFVVAELIIVLGAGFGIFLTWPDVPWKAITWILAFLMALAPVVFYPIAKTLWLAVDLTLRPPTSQDLMPPGEGSDEGPALGPEA